VVVNSSDVPRITLQECLDEKSPKPTLPRYPPERLLLSRCQRQVFRSRMNMYPGLVRRYRLAHPSLRSNLSRHMLLLSSSAGTLVPNSINATSMLWKQLVESHLSRYDITPQEHHHQFSSRHTRNNFLQTVILIYTKPGIGLVRVRVVKEEAYRQLCLQECNSSCSSPQFGTSEPGVSTTTK
jgi:hypothetical protein